ncbi:hypothetical protein [Saccharopolyspora sp. NPDC002578]
MISGRPAKRRRTVSARAAPWPQQWAGFPDWRPWLLVSASAVLALVSFAVALHHAVEGWPAGTRYVAMFGLLFTELAGMGVLARLRMRKSGGGALRLTATDEAAMAVELPYSRVQFAGFVLVALTAAAPTVFGFVGALEKDRPLIGRAVVLAVAAVVLLSLPASMLRGSFAAGTVRLTPSGVHHRGWTHDGFLPWTSIAEVRAVPGDGPEIWVLATADARWSRRQIARLWKEDRLPRSPMLRIPGRDLAGDPALLYALLRHYHRNPAARAEIGTERSLRDARTGAFLAGTGSADEEAGEGPVRSP